MKWSEHLKVCLHDRIYRSEIESGYPRTCADDRLELAEGSVAVEIVEADSGGRDDGKDHVHASHICARDRYLHVTEEEMTPAPESGPQCQTRGAGSDRVVEHRAGWATICPAASIMSVPGKIGSPGKCWSYTQ